MSDYNRHDFNRVQEKRGDEFADKDFGDKVKDTAKHAKEAVKEGWDKMVGNTPEDKAAKNMKETADCCAKQMKDARERAADQMRDTARHIEGH